ncbi:condensin subunit SMC4 [Cyberlindnera jadinii NRRL Y-1542]|uniref:Structural maintenance of chromosomes protein 4 n=1 Tax=Cyberlindnera jadinii (strain ATCC 18201 / CBS 1600 / BCRC 20928 / JCM 3617 / NBRC 0987 / NRRL Y-1542) TaxID=983966 RepID=A0A1E4S6B9_CYBJN|nr:RecF/RecN/SMC protein [Cyberlindnera jadinii NRRL Y-1542]ODV74932.1 RecF/RecN/SMC protein [Cyberlindnera jadinii NRRL Y-1542]
MSSPPAKRRHLGPRIPDDEDSSTADAADLVQKSDALSASASPQSPSKERRSSLAPLDTNVPLKLDSVKLDPPSDSSPRQQSPKSKPSFNGEPTTRLVIDRLVLTNFKSYAGKQVIGPFDSSFSAVVGPNGSGKSNVIDAMLFVFGFRANKMRQGKLSELIHNSETAPNLESCSVDIYFHNVQDNVDETTSVIPETYRNNGSDYFINNKRSNKGIDLDHKRFLILQGEVETEKENDDGTSNYQKVEELNEICQEKETRDSLEGKKQEALDFIRKEKELVENQSLLLRYNIHQSEKNIEMNTENEQKESSDFQTEALMKSIGSIEEEIQQLETAQRKDERDRVMNKKKKAEKLLETAITALNQANNKHSTLSDENEKFSKDLEEKSILDEIRSELTDKTKAFNEEIEIHQAKLRPWTENRVQILKEGRSTLKDRLKEIKLSLLKKEKTHNASQIQIGEQECEHAAGKLKAMEESTLEARGSLSTIQNKSKVLAGLMRLQESGHLGYIDDKYDLDDMVVESVEYLRKNNLGYARFILLTKLRKFNLGKIQTPNNVPRLFDLVTPQDPKFAPAFYSVLQDTLVASNLQEANKVAYGAKRFRVVTLDGKLIDKSGTLSGGGNIVNRGGMKSTSQAGSVSESEVLKMEKQLSEKEQKLEIAQNTYYEMTGALKELKERQPEIDTEVSKIKYQIDSLTNEMKSVQTQVAAATKKRDEMAADNKEIAEAEANEQSKELQDKINVLQEQILNVGGVKLRMQNSKVDSVAQQIEIASHKLNNNKVGIKKLENEIKRYTKSESEKKKEIEDYQCDLSRVEETYQERLRVFEKLETELKKLRDSKDENKEKAELLKESLDEKLEKINLLRSAQVEIENKIEKHQSIIKHQTAERLRNTEHLDTLEFRDVSTLLSFIEDEEERVKYENGSLSDLTPDELEALDIDTIQIKVEDLEAYMSKVKVDTDILEEYARRTEEYQTRRTDLNSAVEERDQIKTTAEVLKKKRLDEFMEGFNLISATLKEMYQMITMGGNAELELVDSLDPFSEGILFSVMPPKKSWKNISNLSGGEKTLSSLALVFALHRYKPTPLYVMDEIDAALDFRNVSIVANYIKERTKNAQFIVISLRNNMFELAQNLVGIYKVSNMTRSITLKNHDMLNNDQ